jgi:hypothetical protein
MARDAARLAGRTRDTVPQDDRLETEAAREAAASARRMAIPEAEAAADHADEAARSLANLAERLTGEEAGEAEPLAEEAEYLARRQEQLADGMRMLAQPDQSALAESRQDALHDDTSGLRAEAEAVRDLLAQVAPDDRAVQEADAGVHESARAQAAEAEAQTAIGGEHAAEALGPQRDAMTALNAAALAFDRLNNRLEQVAAWDRRSDLGLAQAEEAGPVAEAAAAAREAARSAHAEDAAHAADRLRAAAGRAREQSLTLGLRPAAMRNAVAYMPGRAEPTGRRRQGPRDGRAPDLRAIGLTTEDWARLPSRLRGEVLQAAGDDVPPEYRALVKSYFRAVARRSMSEPAAGATAREDAE